MANSTTNAMTGALSTSSATTLSIVLPTATNRLQLVVKDATSLGTVAFAINGESVNATTNSQVLASGIATPITSTLGIGTITLYQNGGTASATYWLSDIFRQGS